MVGQFGGFRTPPVITSPTSPAQWQPTTEMVRESFISLVMLCGDYIGEFRLLSYISLVAGGATEARIYGRIQFSLYMDRTAVNNQDA